MREICERAQVNRSTFYKYYGSQYDLFNEMEEETLRYVNQQLSGAAGMVSGNLSQITNLIAFVDENAALCRIIINHNTDPNFPNALINLPCLREWIDSNFRAIYAKNEMEYVYGLVVNGGFSVIRQWINKDDREPPEVIAALLVARSRNSFPRPRKI